MNAFASAVRAAVVRVGALGDGYDRGDEAGGAPFWGSGFFIAPGWVLTSAHVVGRGRGAVWRGERVIGITTAAGERFAGELVCGLPSPPDPGRPPASWEDPDLALVRVPEAEAAVGAASSGPSGGSVSVPGARTPSGPGGPADTGGTVASPGVDCLWLSDRSALAPAEVGLYGWTSGAGPGAERYVGGAGTVSGGSGGPLVLRGGFPRAGCSGGPVVDLSRGSVIGISKGRSRAGDEAGLAVPITASRGFCDAGPAARESWHEALRAHDRYHWGRYRGPGQSWPRVQTDLEIAANGLGFTAGLRAELFGRLAELPPPGSAGQVLEMVNEARSEVLSDSYQLDVPAPRSWREGVGMLYAPHDGRPNGPDAGRDFEREAVLLYAVKVYASLCENSAPGTLPGPRPTPAAERTPAQVREPVDPVALDALRQWIEETAVTLQTEQIRQRIVATVGRPFSSGAARPDAPFTGGGSDPERSPTPRPPAYQAPTAAYADVLVEIDPDFYGTHSWRVKLVHEDGQVSPVEHNDAGVPREDLEHSIRAALARALDSGDIGEHLAAVDFMLPRSLFDEPVEWWRVREPAPEEPFSPHTLPLGRRRTVALRDQHRWTQPIIPEWRSRWSGVARGPLDAVPLCDEAPRSGHDQPRPESAEAAYARLQRMPRHAVPVHCAGVGGGRGAVAMSVALAAGYPVALWRRCGEQQHEDCAEFLDRAARLLRTVGTDEEQSGLPEVVRTLRNRNADPGAPDPDAAWARELVLLYDPPHGPRLPDDALRAPPLQQDHRQDA